MTHRLPWARWGGWAGLLFAAVALPAVSHAQNAPGLEPGLSVTFASADGKFTDTAVLSNVWLFVGQDQPPTPFVPGGPFAATWRGLLKLDLRGDYAFRAELNGRLKLELNGKPVLETNGTGGFTTASEFVRLRKGTNEFIATFQSPPNSDSRLRLEWIPRSGMPAPLPSNALSHPPTEAQARANQVRLGRELFLEHRCAKCHDVSHNNGAAPELSMDAPSFEGIGSRRNFAWMVAWILEPHAQRPGAHMPRLLSGPQANSDAEAAAAFLASLKSSAPLRAEQGGDVEAGRKLFEALHCAACHQQPNVAADDPKKISLRHAASKFSAGALDDFLKKPEAHFAWIRMPNFRLNSDEARNLTEYLFAHANKPAQIPTPSALVQLERGKTIVQNSGCLNCHSARLENRFQAPALARLPASRWNSGCLASKRNEDSRAPEFAFTSDERGALRAFAATDRSSLARHSPTQFAERQARLLNCAACHGQFEGFPPLEILGGKLKPEWVKSFLAGEVPYKPRPWLEARMPSFASRAELLAHGLAALHGVPPRTPAEPPPNETLAGIGLKLVSADGGFACTACHAVGRVAATQVFESAGVNLAHSGARLLRPYFERWLLNPLVIEPATKMPAYFDEEGKSPLTDLLDGNGAQQIDAIWQYLQLGEKMPPPITAPPAQ